MNYKKRLDRILPLVIDLGQGDTLNIKYKPSRLTVSLLAELEANMDSANQPVEKTDAESEQPAAEEELSERESLLRYPTRHWEAVATSLCQIVCSWDLKSTREIDGQETEYDVPLTVQGLRGADLDLLDMTAIVNCIKEAQSADPPKPLNSTTT